MRKFVLLVVALMGFSVAFAQTDVLAVAQEANDALGAKNYAKAAQLLETVIADGADSEEDAVLEQVNSAKKNLPIAYFRVGGAAAAAAQKATTPEAKDAKYAEAIKMLNTALEKATTYKNTAVKNNAGRMLGLVYQSQGGEYFNGGNYEKAAEIFAKGYEADKKNTAMALNLAESYFKMDKYAEGVKVCSEVAALPSPKYDAAIAKAKATMSQYTNNKIAAMQQANDFDGIIKMSETIADKALAQKVAVQAYFLKKDYAKVIEIGEAAAALQTDDESKSAVYFNLGSAYNAKEMRDKAIEALKKVTAEPYATPAKAAVAELSK